MFLLCKAVPDNLTYIYKYDCLQEGYSSEERVTRITTWEIWVNTEDIPS